MVWKYTVYDFDYFRFVIIRFMTQDMVCSGELLQLHLSRMYMQLIWVE